PSGDIARAKTGLALDKITEGHFQLIRELFKSEQGDRRLDVSRFAELDEREWTWILERRRDPDDPASEPIGHPPGYDSNQAYARSISRNIERTFPTQVIADRVSRDLDASSPFRELQTDLRQFFANNKDFRFGESPVETYLAVGADEKFNGVQR